MTLYRRFGFAAIVGMILSLGLSGQQAASTVFTAAQATAGRARYIESCAGCHGPELGGGGHVPPLAGPGFLKTWGRSRPAISFPIFAPACRQAGRPRSRNRRS